MKNKIISVLCYLGTALVVFIGVSGVFVGITNKPFSMSISITGLIVFLSGVSIAYKLLNPINTTVQQIQLPPQNEHINAIEMKSEIESYGLYAPHFDFDTSEKYKIALTDVRNKEKELISNERAAIGSTTWKVNGSITEGKRQTKHYIKLMLRAFNGECEALLADVRWNNITKMEERLNKSYEAINKLGETHQISMTNEYLRLKTKELLLTYEYREKKQQEKEEQRRIQEQIREEEKTQREIDKTIKESEDEEKKYSKALEQAKKELENAQGNMVLELRQKIKKLQEELTFAQQNKVRALSMAQQTKAGHVYIISNIGSFGDNVFKIGMTRRLEPMDRVKELGDASVPFSFDVHAMIYTDNAPELETLLHKQFEHKRINMINNRREFFQTTLTEIENTAKNYNPNIEFTHIPEAKEYRESIEIKKTLKNSLI